MKADDFARQLQCHPLRPVPGAWREEILSAARQASRVSPADNHSRAAIQRSSSWREWLWPNSWAWLGVSAVWMVTTFFYLNTASVPVPGSSSVNAIDTILVSTFLEQKLELTRLLETSIPPAPKPQPPADRPRSHGRSETMMV